MSVSTMVEGESHPNGSDIASLPPLIQLQFVSTTVLQQALDLVENILTSDDQLTAQSKFLPGSTIGDTTLYVINTTLSMLLRDCLQENICGMHEITLFSSSNVCQGPPHISFHMTPAAAIHQWRIISLKLERPSSKLSRVLKK